MPNKKQIKKISKQTIISFVALSTILWSAGLPVFAAAPQVTGVTVSTTSIRVTFDQEVISDESGGANYSSSARNLVNFSLESPTNTSYPLHSSFDHWTDYYVSGGTNGVANIYGLNLIQNDSYRLQAQNIKNPSLLETMTAFDGTGTVAASTDPQINYIENISSGAVCNPSGVGYPCAQVSEQLTLKGLRFNTGVEGAQVVINHGGGSSLSNVTPSDAETINFTIPSGVNSGNVQFIIKNLNDNSLSNVRDFAVLDNVTGSVGGVIGIFKLSDNTTAVNNVTVRVERFHSLSGQAESHSNGRFAVAISADSNYDVSYITPAGATEGAPTQTTSQTITAGTITSLGTKNFLTANVTGTIKNPDGTSTIRNARVIVHDDPWNVIQQAFTDASGNYKIYVPVPSLNNYYRIEVEPPQYYQASPFNYLMTEVQVNISQNGSDLNRIINLATLNVQGTVKTPTTTSTLNPNPDVVVPNANVGLHTPNWSWARWTNTNSSGVFQFAGVPAGTDYILEIEPPWGDATFGAYSRSAISGLTVASSGVTDLGVRRLALPNVSGRVLAGGNPVSGVWVNLDKEGFWAGANTGSDGKFKLNVPSNGTYRLHINATTGYAAYDAEVNIDTLPTPKDLGDIALSAPNVSGTVYDPTGATPQQNLGIDVCPYNTPGQCYWGNTDSNGQFGLRVPDGTWGLQVRIWGTSIYAAPATVVIVISGGSVTSVNGGGATALNNIRLTDPAVNGLKGVVRGPVGSADENNGIANAQLGLRTQGSMGMSNWTNTDNNGQFAFGSVSAGTYELEVMPSWGSSYSRKTYIITVDAAGNVTSNDTGFTAVSTRNIIVRLTQPNISGTLKTPVWDASYSSLGITQSQFDQAVQWGWVNLRSASPGPGGPGQWYGANTNESGQFSIGGVLAGSYIIEYHPGWGSAFSMTQSTITVSAEVAAGTSSLNLGTPRLSLPQLVGSVVKPDASTAVRDAWVMVFNDFHTVHQGSNTDSNGQFRIGGLADGTYSIEVNMPWGKGLVAPSNLTVVVASGIGVVKQSGTTLPNNKITLQEPTNTLSGWVKKSGTNAVSNARVEAHRDMGGGFVEVRTDSSGNYSMKLSDGSWWVEVRPDWGTEIDWVYNEPPTRVTFAGNESKTQNFSVLATDATIYGYVKKADGTAVSNIWVDACQGFGPCTGRNTDSTGRFSIKVAAGTYTINAFPSAGVMTIGSTEYGAPNPKVVTVTTNSTAEAGTLTLNEKNSQIKGRIQDQAGNPIQNVAVNAWLFGGPGWAMGYTDTTGSYTLKVFGGTTTPKKWGVMVIPMSNQYIYQGAPLMVEVLQNEIKANNNFTLKLADATIKGTIKLGSATGTVVTDIWGGVWVRDTSVNDLLDFGGPMSDMMEKSGMMTAGPGAGGAPMGPGMEAGMGTGLFNGSFELKVPAGTYEIGLGMPPGSRYTLSSTATATATSNTTTNVNLIVLDNDATISGTFYIDTNNNDIYDAGTDTIATGIRARVHADRPAGGWQDTESNSSTGTYSLLVSAGTWYIDAFIDQFMTFGGGGDQYMIVAPDQSVTVTSGATSTLNFKVKQRNATIQGQVTDPDGAGMSGVWVFVDFGTADMVDEFKGPGGPGLGTFTGANGTYSLKVPAGTYKIGAGIPPWDTRDLLSPDFITATVAANATSTGNNLQFKSSNARISGTVLLSGSPQRAYVRAWSTAGRGTGTEAFDGTYTLKVTQNDTWHVVAVAEVGDTLYESSETTIVTTTATTNCTGTPTLQCTGKNLTLSSLGITLPDPKTVTFDASQSKTVTLSDGLTVEIPAGAIETSGTITVTVTPTVDVKADADEKLVGYAYDFEARNSDGQEITDFVQNVTITMPYTESFVATAGYSEDSITPKYYDESTGSWENYDTVIRDTTNNNIIIKTDHFSPGGNQGGNVPIAPSNLSASAASSSSIELSWTDNSTNETGFKIYRDGTLITTTAADVTSYTDTGLSASTSYSYYVKATNASGDSAASNTASATTQSAATAGGFVFVPSGGGAAPAEEPTPAEEPAPTEESAPTPEPEPEIEITLPTIPTLEKPISEMTIEEITAKITEFLAVIEQLKALLVQITPVPTVVGIPTDYKFEATLKQGQTSIDVKYLQIFLNSDFATRVAETGVGSSGQETNYFGPLTKAAVIKFQERYPTEILTPWDLTEGTGLVAKTTRAKINVLLGR